MSHSASSLSARPSLEQLRKRAKELLRNYQAGEAGAVKRFHAMSSRLANPGRPVRAVLADAQFILAREQGFESWAKLVHYIEAVQHALPGQFERLAQDFVAAYQGDDDSLLRINDLYGRSLTWHELRSLVQKRLSMLAVPANRTAEFELADAQVLIARECGFESWSKLVESAAQPQIDPRSAPLGLSSKPPYYRID